MGAVSSKLAKNQVSKRTKLLSVPMILILLCGFFLPWGPGMQKVATLYISKVFAAFGFLLIIYWFLFARDKFNVFPPFFNYFVLFIVLHTFITHFLLSSEGWIFKYLEHEYKAGGIGFLKVRESLGIQAARVFIFILLSYAVAYFLKNDNDRRVTVMTLAYGAGLTATIMIGGFVYVSALAAGTDTRLSAGFLDPNCFGSHAFSVIFLSLLIVLRPKLNIVVKLLATGYILIAMLGLLSSSSRSALLALCTGFMVILIYMPGLRKKIRFASVSLLLAVAIFALVPQNYREILKARVSIERLLADQRGKGRLKLWPEYLKQTPKYFLTGNGLGQAEEVLKDSPIHAYSPHNEYLYVLVQYGIVGLLCFFLALWQLWQRVRYRMHQYKTTARDAVYLGFFSAWLVFIFLVDAHIARNWWFSLGIIAAYGCSRIRTNRADSEDVTPITGKPTQM